MPIEIKELHLKMNIEGDGKGEKKLFKGRHQKKDESKQNLVQECVDEVLRIMDEKQAER